MLALRIGGGRMAHATIAPCEAVIRGIEMVCSLRRTCRNEQGRMINDPGADDVNEGDRVRTREGGVSRERVHRVCLAQE